MPAPDLVGEKTIKTGARTGYGSIRCVSSKHQFGEAVAGDEASVNRTASRQIHSTRSRHCTLKRDRFPVRSAVEVSRYAGTRIDADGPLLVFGRRHPYDARAAWRRLPCLDHPLPDQIAPAPAAAPVDERLSADDAPTRLMPENRAPRSHQDPKFPKRYHAHRSLTDDMTSPERSQVNLIESS